MNLQKVPSDCWQFFIISEKRKSWRTLFYTQALESRTVISSVLIVLNIISVLTTYNLISATCIVTLKLPANLLVL